jgi:hypothetical protein
VPVPLPCVVHGRKQRRKKSASGRRRLLPSCMNWNFVCNSMPSPHEATVRRCRHGCPVMQMACVNMKQMHRRGVGPDSHLQRRSTLCFMTFMTPKRLSCTCMSRIGHHRGLILPLCNASWFFFGLSGPKLCPPKVENVSLNMLPSFQVWICATKGVRPPCTGR